MAQLTREGKRKKNFDSLSSTVEKKCDGLARKCQAEVVVFIKPYGETTFAAYRSSPNFLNLIEISNDKCKTPDDFISKKQHLRNQETDPPALFNQTLATLPKRSNLKIRKASMQSSSGEGESFKSCHSSSDEKELVEPGLHVIIPSSGKVVEDQSTEIPEITPKDNLMSQSFSPTSPAPIFKLRRRRRLSSSPLRSPYQLGSPQLFGSMRRKLFHNDGIVSAKSSLGKAGSRAFLQRTLSPKIGKHPRSPVSSEGRRVTRSLLLK